MQCVISVVKTLAKVTKDFYYSPQLLTFIYLFQNLMLTFAIIFVSFLALLVTSVTSAIYTRPTLKMSPFKRQRRWLDGNISKLTRMLSSSYQMLSSAQNRPWIRSVGRIRIQTPIYPFYMIDEWRHESLLWLLQSGMDLII